MDKLQLLFKQAPQTFASSSIVSGLLLYVLWNEVNHTLLLTWFAIILCGNLIRLLLVKTYASTTVQSEKKANICLQRFMIVTAFVGASWGIGTALFLQQTPITYHFFIIMILTGVSAGALPAYTTSLLTYRLFLIPCLLIPSIWMMVQSNEMLTFTGLLFALYAVLMLSLNKRQHTTISESLRLKYENNQLLEELELEVYERKLNEEQLSHSQEKLKQKTEHLQSLLHLSKALEQADSYEKIMQAVTLEIKEAFGFNHAWIYLMTDKPDEWQLLSPEGNSDLHLAKDLPKLNIRGDWMLEEVANATNPVIITDAQIDPRTNKDIVNKLGNRTIINIPMMLTGNSIGALGTGTFTNEGVYHLSTQQIDHLSAMTSHVALAIDRVRLFTERLEIQAQMEHAQRLDSLGLMAGGIAHDFNNILSSIMGHAALAGNDAFSNPATTKNHVAKIVDSSKKAAALCHQMLAYSGKGQFVIEDVDLSRSVEGIQPLLESSIGQDITIHYQLEKELPVIEVDVTQIQQVIMNLVINASEAITDQIGEIFVSTGLIFADDDYLARCYSASPVAGQYVFLEVRDTGCGMNPETAAKIFDPFFTTKFTGRGLGMSAILGIMRGHQGGILLHSEISKGTMFRILFPALETSSPITTENNDTAVSVIQSKRKQGKILIIDDDDEEIRDLVVSILKNSGFEVLCGVDGEDGVNVYKQHQHEIALVLLDLTMPRLSGADCYEALYQINTDIRVIIMSGYSEDESMRHFDDNKPVRFISKPFMPKLLMEKIFEAIPE